MSWPNASGLTGFCNSPLQTEDFSFWKIQKKSPFDLNTTSRETVERGRRDTDRLEDDLDRADASKGGGEDGNFGRREPENGRPLRRRFSLQGKDLQECYDGEVSTATGKREGRGRYAYPNKAFTYDGEYVGGKKHGHGKFTIEGHSHYEGSFENDEIEGEGRQVYADGSVYEGSFHLGERHGKGSFTDRRKRERYVGDYRFNARHGEGVLVLEGAGATYSGHFEENKPCGQGKLEPADGAIYAGTFARDPDQTYANDAFGSLRVSLSGSGSIKHPDGSYQEGEFERNELNGVGLHYNVATGITLRGVFKGNSPVAKAEGIACHFFALEAEEEAVAAEPAGEDGGEEEAAETEPLPEGKDVEGEEEAEEEAVAAPQGEGEGAEQVEEKAEAPQPSQPEGEGDEEAPAVKTTVIEGSILELDSSQRGTSWAKYGIQVSVQVEVFEEEPPQEEEAAAQEEEEGGEAESGGGPKTPEASKQASPAKEEAAPAAGEEADAPPAEAETKLATFADESGRTVVLKLTREAVEEAASEDNQAESAEEGAAQEKSDGTIEVELKTTEGVATVDVLADLLSAAEPGQYNLEFFSAGLDSCKLTLIVS